MRVLLTGSAGFIGRHLHTALDARGDNVTAIDIVNGPDALDLFRFNSAPYDLAIHCAAIVGGRASIDGSPLGVGTNLGLDAWYMRWLARSGTPRAVYFSSSAAYPVALQQPGPIRRLVETDIGYQQPGRPDATYGLAKLTGEQLCQYAEAEGTRMTILRPFSGYGGDQDEAYPFPAFIRRARERQDPFEIDLGRSAGGTPRHRPPRRLPRHRLRLRRRACGHPPQAGRVRRHGCRRLPDHARPTRPTRPRHAAGPQ